MGTDNWFALAIASLVVAALVVSFAQRRRRREQETSRGLSGVPRATERHAAAPSRPSPSGARPAGDVVPLEDERKHGRTFADAWLDDEGRSELGERAVGSEDAS
jgi:hypothetical protein